MGVDSANRKARAGHLDGHSTFLTISTICKKLLDCSKVIFLSEFRDFSNSITANFDEIWALVHELTSDRKDQNVSRTSNNFLQMLYKLLEALPSRNRE